MSNLAKVQFLRDERAGAQRYKAGEYAGITENEATRLQGTGAVRIVAIVPESVVAAGRAAGVIAGARAEGQSPAEHHEAASAPEKRATKPGRTKARK